jgi:N utilization substance protein B
VKPKKKKPHSPRHKGREVAFQVLYRYDVAKKATGAGAPGGPALAEELKGHFEHFDVSDEARTFAAQLVAGTLEHVEDLDKRIEATSANWRLSRMGFVDRSILRLAAYELIHMPEIAASVTIDEAVELAKQFGTDQTPAFVNGVLDALARAASK